MIDEKDVTERFHSAFEAQPSAGAAQRLRSILLEADHARPTRPRPMPHRLHVSLRVVAALVLIAVAIATSGALLALHRALMHSVPANQSTTTHSTARSSWGMVSATVGWQQTSWVDVNGLNHVLRTTDAGAHWSDVSPPANLYAPAGKGSVFSVGGNASVYALDGDHLWLGQIAPGAGFSQVTTLATADGGRTWKRGQSFRSSGPSSTSTCSECASAGLTLYFLDANHGWMLVQYFNTISINVTPGEQNQLYRTTDGGMSWLEIARVEAIAANGEQFVNSLCSWRDVAFASPEDGWLSVACRRQMSPGTGLLVTHDGGATWSSQSLPAPADAQCACAWLPVVFDRMHAMVQVSIPDASGPYVLITADGGQTWVAREMPAPWALDFVDPLHGWGYVANSAGDLYHTTDGGVNWSRVSISMPSTQDLYFVDLRSGFATVTTGDTSNSELWKTTDGGQTWSRVGLMPPAMQCPISGCTTDNRI